MSWTPVRTTWFPLLHVEDLELTVSTFISARDVRQIIRSGAPAPAKAGDQVVDHNGGDARALSHVGSHAM